VLFYKELKALSRFHANAVVFSLWRAILYKEKKKGGDMKKAIIIFFALALVVSWVNFGLAKQQGGTKIPCEWKNNECMCPDKCLSNSECRGKDRDSCLNAKKNCTKGGAANAD